MHPANDRWTLHCNIIADWLGWETTYNVMFISQWQGAYTKWSLNNMHQSCHGESIDAPHGWPGACLDINIVLPGIGMSFMKMRWMSDHPIFIMAIPHYSDVIMGTMASQITNLIIVCSTVYSGADQRKHQSSTSLAFVRGIQRWPVNSLHKVPAMWKMFPFDDVTMILVRQWLQIMIRLISPSQ